MYVFLPQDKLINKLLPIEVNICTQFKPALGMAHTRAYRMRQTKYRPFTRFIYLSDTIVAIVDAYLDACGEIKIFFSSAVFGVVVIPPSCLRILERASQSQNAQSEQAK